MIATASRETTSRVSSGRIPNRRGLLYAGTETGVYVSFDDGENWQSFQANLPVCPIHDLIVKGTDLIAATHGRSFWILDDLTPLHQMQDDIAERDGSPLPTAPGQTLPHLRPLRRTVAAVQELRPRRRHGGDELPEAGTRPARSTCSSSTPARTRPTA